jgi:acetate kinase
LSQSAALEGIRAARQRWPELPQVAVFDTAFHVTLPRHVRQYALPRALTADLGLRRYGAHGISHSQAAKHAAHWLGADLDTLRLVTCHLGATASVTAVEYGRSVETSMGMTRLEGLVMSTRPGDLDPGILLAILKSGRSPAELEQILEHESGLVGLTGTDDMHVVEEQARQGALAARLALQMFAHRLKKYIGAYAAVMGGLDAIVFTGRIGERSAPIRSRVLSGLEFLGVSVDEDRNQDVTVSHDAPVADLSSSAARCKALVVANDEAAAIAVAAHRVVTGRALAEEAVPIPIAVSARHVHLCKQSVERLFGEGHVLSSLRPVTQHGQYAATDTVTLVGPRGRIPMVRVVGPERAVDQVEISRTDEFLLGINAPVRESGDLAETPGIVLEGPKGTIALSHGVICASRHIHMSPAEAVELGVREGDEVDVRVASDHRELIFGNVVIRVHKDFVLEMHIDTDEANAAGLSQGSIGLLERHTARASAMGRH